MTKGDARRGGFVEGECLPPQDGELGGYWMEGLTGGVRKFTLVGV